MDNQSPPPKPRKKKPADPGRMQSARAAWQEKYRQNLQRFAIAYADPTSSTFMSARRSYQVLFPESSDSNARTQAKKYMEEPECRELIAEIQTEAKAMSGITAARFVKDCLTTEEKLLEKALTGGGRNASLAHAAAKYRQLAGKAAGLLVERVEDMTPPERRALGTAEALKVLQEAYERVNRLSEGNPLPQIAAPTEEAEYEVLSLTEVDHEPAEDDKTDQQRDETKVSSGV